MLDCVGALRLPSTGILDSHAYMLALQGDAEDHGAAIAFNTPFLGARRANSNVSSCRAGGAEPVELTARYLDQRRRRSMLRSVARSIEGLDAEFIPETLYAKGNYFMLAGRAPFSRLIYPAPADAWPWDSSDS